MSGRLGGNCLCIRLDWGMSSHRDSCSGGWRKRRRRRRWWLGIVDGRGSGRGLFDGSSLRIHWNCLVDKKRDRELEREREKGIKEDEAARVTSPRQADAALLSLISGEDPG